MTLDEVQELAQQHNESDEGRYHAVPFDVGAFGILLLRDRQTGRMSPSYIVEPEEYLRLIQSGSAAVDYDAFLRQTLTDWLRLRATATNKAIP